MKADNRLHFGVPILEVQLQEVRDRAADIAQALLQLRATESGIQRSNQRGWHSADDLFNRPEPVYPWLSDVIFQIAGKLIRHAERLPDDEELLLSSLWANINDAGAWNAPHAHLPCEWSGVLYIDVNETPAESQSGIHDGDILFFDPIPVGAPYRPAATVAYTPKIGTLYVFPSYLLHMVAPHFDERPRISLAFNFRIARNLKQFAR
ncbi:TIGR02466 family protein [Thalassolituus sp. LLYu03]|uniref:TIGR02466 family protein n=1 Tax=Thalassolituus sp. LLYu03 TaxID=3421656 RepID=UPI003D2C3D0F